MFLLLSLFVIFKEVTNINAPDMLRLLSPLPLIDPLLEPWIFISNATVRPERRPIGSSVLCSYPSNVPPSLRLSC